MSSNWITAAITRTRQRSAAAPDAVWIQLEALLRDKFSEQQLSSGELRTAAKALIAGMTPTQPKVEGPR